MTFEPIPVTEAAGHILGHHIAGADGRRAFRKGTPLTEADVVQLQALGRETVYVAKLAADDVDEDTAATRIAGVVAGEGVRPARAATGRVNMYADVIGLLHVDVEGLLAVNGCNGVTLATLPQHSAVAADRMVATLKIIPYALPEVDVAHVEALTSGRPLLRLRPLPAQRVGLILSGSPAAEERVVRGFEKALADRLARLNAEIARVDYVPQEDEQGELDLAATLQAHLAEGLAMVVLAGETAIMDRYDIAPRAVERVGGEVVCFGAPVDPGNLLMLGYHGSVPVLGAPGCVRSPKENIIDLVLPRLLAGDRLEARDIITLGHGGLLEDVPERPLPRSRLG